MTMQFPASSETFAGNDARELVERGNDLTIHALRPAPSQASQWIAERGLREVDVCHNRGLITVMKGSLLSLVHLRASLALIGLVVRSCHARPQHLLKSFLLMPRVLEIFDQTVRQRPDVVHAYWGHYPTLVLYLLQRFLPDVVTSVSFRAYDIDERYGPSRPVAHRADFVGTQAAVNVPTISEVYGVPGSDIEVIHAGVDIRLVPKTQDRTARRIVTAGRLIAGKATDQVIHAFAQVHEKYPDATLRVLGSGPELPHLTGLAENLGLAASVTFMGHVSHETVLSEMRSAEVFLFLSESERLPNVVKEAMACGCVCVASRTAGIEALITDTVNGFIVEQADADRAAQRVLDVFGGQHDSRKIVEAAAAKVRDEFSLEVSVRQLLDHWKHLVARKRSSSMSTRTALSDR